MSSFGFDLHYPSVYQDDFGENLGCALLELHRQSTKPWNLMWWFSGCQRVELGVMANGAASALSVCWGFLNTKTSATEQNASLYTTWTVRSHANEAMALSVVVTCSQRWQAELPVSTAVQQLCGCWEPRRVEWDGKCPWWRRLLHGCKEHLLWRGPDLYLNCRAQECWAPTGWGWNRCRLGEYLGEVTLCIAPFPRSFWDICFWLQRQDQSWYGCCSYVSQYLAGFWEAFKGGEVWCLPDVFWTNSLKDWRSYLGLN